VKQGVEYKLTMGIVPCLC